MSITRVFSVVFVRTALVAFCCGIAIRADEVTFQDVSNQTLTQNLKLIHNGGQRSVFETAAGQWLVVENSRIEKQTEKAGPEALSVPAVLEDRQRKFKDSNLHVHAKTNATTALLVVMSDEPPADAGKRLDGLAEDYLETSERVTTAVAAWAKPLKLTEENKRWPKVIVLMEYTLDLGAHLNGSVNLEDGPALLNYDQWYSPRDHLVGFSLQNQLGMNSPDLGPLVFQELVQQGLVPRLGNVPVVMLAGLAAGFESTPTKITPPVIKPHPRWATFLMSQKDRLDWDRLWSEDNFYKDWEKKDFDLYMAEAWALHWYLQSKFKVGYTRFWQKHQSDVPLTTSTAEERLAEFKELFKTTPSDLQDACTKALEQIVNSPKFANTQKKINPDVIEACVQFGKLRLEVSTDNQNRSLSRGSGHLMNVNPIRPMTFHVQLYTDSATATSWFFDRVPPGGIVKLPRQATTEKMTTVKASKTPVGGRVAWISGTPSDTPQADDWRNGKFPVPQLSFK